MSDETIIAVRRKDIVRYGLGPAVVLQQIRHNLDHRKDGWFEGSWDDLGRLCGLSGKQVRTAAGHLIEAGALEQERRVTGQGEQKPRFRPSASGAGDRSGTLADHTGTPRADRSGSPSLHSERGNDKPPLTPPEGGEVAGQGALDLGNDPEPVRTRRKRAAAANPMLAATYDEWVGNYPPGPQRGDRKRGLAAFEKALKVDSVDTLHVQLHRYVQARELFRSAVGESPSLMNVATFLNGKRTMFEREWTRAEALSYWPVPPGVRAALQAETRSPRGETREEMVRREQAEWEAEQAAKAAALAEKLAEFEDDEGEWV